MNEQLAYMMDHPWMTNIWFVLPTPLSDYNLSNSGNNTKIHTAVTRVGLLFQECLVIFVKVTCSSEIKINTIHNSNIYFL